MGTANLLPIVIHYTTTNYMNTYTLLLDMNSTILL